MLNVSEADTVEELAEVGIAFLEMEFMGERCSLLHGDEQHPRVVIQCFSGFKINELDLFDWLQWNWDSQLQVQGSCLLLGPTDFRGRNALLAGLFCSDGTYLGFMHVDRERPFSHLEQAKLGRIAATYGHRLGSLVLGVPSEDVTESSVESSVEPSVEDCLEFHREWVWMDYA